MRRINLGGGSDRVRVKIGWDPRFAIDVPEIDAQHKDIFRCAGLLVRAMDIGQVETELRDLVAFLEDYVVSHFGAEEALMAKHAWPELEVHLGLHRQFKNELARQRAAIDAEGPTPSLVTQFSNHVCAWLTGHIASEDRRFGEFLEARRGLRP